MSDYPILVERFDAKHPADLAICTGCARTRTIDPSDGDPYDLCLECWCGSPIVFKYDVAPKCPGCGRLSYDANRVDGACSRRCALQAEYAEQLERQRGAA